MKPPERFSPDDPREWLNRARSNLAMARNRVPDAYLVEEREYLDAVEIAETVVRWAEERL
jgi:hypothetical protein